MRTSLLAVALLFGLTACSQSSASDADISSGDSTQPADESLISAAGATEATEEASRSRPSNGDISERYSISDDEEFDEDAARQDAEDELSSQGYDHSYGCTEDCSGHQAGWGYQAQQGYGSYPSGNSRSFEEGRLAFDEAVDERVEEARSEWSEYDE